MGQFATPEQAMKNAAKEESALGARPGNVIVVYSPQGGAGVTTIATSIATLLMNKGIRVLMADADLQFGDVATFLDIKAQATIIELLPDADDLDPEHFDNIIATHGSGLKVLVAPNRPEQAEEITKNRPGVYAQIIDKVRRNYDYVVIDTATALDDVSIGLFDLADQIVLVTTPSLPSIKNARFVVDLFDKLGYPKDKVMLVLNKVYAERDRKNSTLPTDRIQSFLRRTIHTEIPIVDERILMASTLRGVPITIAERERTKPPLKQYADITKALVEVLTEEDDDDMPPVKAIAQPEKEKKPGGLFRR
jgi:pilus assembly protein CpaE